MDKVAAELVKIAKVLTASDWKAPKLNKTLARTDEALKKISSDLTARSVGVSNIIRDFLKKMEARFNMLADSKKRLERMQYEETGIGGLKEDTEVAKTMEHIEQNMEMIDEIIDSVKTFFKRMR